MEQLILHLHSTKGQKVKVIHRFSDNCAAQFKCKYAFGHIESFETKHDVKLVYHFSESGHGKGPSDGIGAGIKKKLENIILGGKVVNNAYQAYLTLVNTNKENQRVIYLPEKRVYPGTAPLDIKVSTINGTQQFHMIRCVGNGILECRDLGCSCDKCLLEVEGECELAYLQLTPVVRFINLKTGKDIPKSDVSKNTESNIDSSNIEVDNDHHVEDAMSAFERGIAEKGWQVKGLTPSDGNCFFHALSDQLQPNVKITHTELRHKLIEYFLALPENKKNELESFMEESLSEYICNMSRDGTYADHIVVQSISNLVQIEIIVVHSTRVNVIILPESQTQNETLRAVIGYLPDIQHYVSLEKFVPFKAEDFVSVHLKVRRRLKMFVAKVAEVEEEDVKLKFLSKTSTPFVYTWPDIADISWVPIRDIKGKLTPPELLPARGIKLRFLSSEIRLVETN